MSLLTNLMLPCSLKVLIYLKKKIKKKLNGSVCCEWCQLLSILVSNESTSKYVG